MKYPLKSEWYGTDSKKKYPLKNELTENGLKLRFHSLNHPVEITRTFFVAGVTVCLGVGSRGMSVGPTDGNGAAPQAASSNDRENADIRKKTRLKIITEQSPNVVYPVTSVLG